MNADKKGAVEISAAPAAPETILQIQNVTKVFNGNLMALKGMSLDVRKGDFISLLGPSGCGKSTALRLVAGLSHTTSGRILWTGAHSTGDIGVVFQEPTLMPWATVAQNVWLPLRLRGKSFASVKKDVVDALTLVGLENFLDSYPRELSGGMKMRVSIARALVTHPKLILMDEPFAALDEITRHKLNDDLLQLRDKIGATIIFVTHSVFESVFLSNRIVVMAARPGRVIRELQVDAAYPRTDEYRASADYAHHCGAATDALHAAMGEQA